MSGEYTDIGAVLNDTYRLERMLGTGGMGTVYEASHLRLARRYALKMLHAIYATEEEPVARFQQEAMVTSGLGHPHIVEVVDFNFTKEGLPYLVMELLEGEDLADRIIRKKRLEVLEAASILRQTASALQSAHQRGIVHRDLKPKNIFLCRRGDQDDFVKVLDFGISKVLGSHTSMTRTSEVMGSPCYIAPEQAERGSAEAGISVDVFAMGTMMYEMLSGRSPFLSDNVPSVLYKIVHMNPPSLRTLQPDIPEAVVSVIDRAMRKRPEDRYESMEVFSWALQTALSDDSAGVGRISSRADWTRPANKESPPGLKHLETDEWHDAATDRWPSEDLDPMDPDDQIGIATQSASVARPLESQEEPQQTYDSWPRPTDEWRTDPTETGTNDLEVTDKGDALEQVDTEEWRPVKEVIQDPKAFRMHTGVTRALDAMGPRAIPPLVQELESDDSSVRLNVVRLLEVMGPKAASAIPMLTRALDDTRMEVRRHAVKALGAVGPGAVSALPALKQRLKDDSSEVREAAARALGELGAKAASAIPALSMALEDRNQQVCTAAEEALRKIRG